MHVLRIQIAFSGGLLVVDGGSKVQNLIASTCGSCCSKYISKKWLVLVFFKHIPIPSLRVPTTQLPAMAMDLREEHSAATSRVPETQLNFENARLSPPSPQPSFKQSKRAAHYPPGMLAKVLHIGIQRSRETSVLDKTNRPRPGRPGRKESTK